MYYFQLQEICSGFLGQRSTPIYREANAPADFLGRAGRDQIQLENGCCLWESAPRDPSNILEADALGVIYPRNANVDLNGLYSKQPYIYNKYYHIFTKKNGSLPFLFLKTRHLTPNHAFHKWWRDGQICFWQAGPKTREVTHVRICCTAQKWDPTPSYDWPASPLSVTLSA